MTCPVRTSARRERLRLSHVCVVGVVKLTAGHANGLGVHRSALNCEEFEVGGWRGGNRAGQKRNEEQRSAQTYRPSP